MDGVTFALILFAFVCVLFPRLIGNRGQYFAGFALTLLVILFTPIVALVGGTAARWLYVLLAIAQVAAVLLLWMSAGGLTIGGLTKDMMGAFEVIRRGQTEKEVIIPIGPDQKDRKRKTAVESRGEPIERFDLSAEVGDAAYPPRKPAAPPAKKQDDDDGPIPMD